jgi:hypothetical protein
MCLFQQFVHGTYFSFFLDDCLLGGGYAVQMKDPIISYCKDRGCVLVKPAT